MKAFTSGSTLFGLAPSCEDSGILVVYILSQMWDRTRARFELAEDEMGAQAAEESLSKRSSRLRVVLRRDHGVWRSTPDSVRAILRLPRRPCSCARRNPQLDPCQSCRR